MVTLSRVTSHGQQHDATRAPEGVTIELGAAPRNELVLEQFIGKYTTRRKMVAVVGDPVSTATLEPASRRRSAGTRALGRFVAKGLLSTISQTELPCCLRSRDKRPHPGYQTRPTSTGELPPPHRARYLLLAPQRRAPGGGDLSWTASPGVVEVSVVDRLETCWTLATV